MNDNVLTGIPRESVSPAANGCQNGKYLRLLAAKVTPALPAGAVGRWRNPSMRPPLCWTRKPSQLWSGSL
jgi:hypothetical protein